MTRQHKSKAGSSNSSTAKAPSNSGNRGRKKTAMHIPADRNIDRSLFLLSHEDFESYFSDILRDDPEASHSLAEMMLRFMDATLEGPQGSIKAIHSYRDGIEILYLDTPAHDLAFDLYVAWLRGQLKPEDEPMTLIKGAMGRQTATDAAHQGRQPHQNEQPGRNKVTKITDKAAAKGSKKPTNRKSSKPADRAPIDLAAGLHRKSSGKETKKSSSAAGNASERIT